MRSARRSANSTADARIETILGYYRELKLDMSWWVGPTSPAWLGDRLVAHGLVLDGIAPALAVSLEGWSAPPRPDGLSMEVVTDAATFHDAMDVMFEGFEMPTEVQPLFEERFRGYTVGPELTQRTYVARLDGQAVATSLGSVLDGIVAIYNVATVPAARRRGAGRRGDGGGDGRCPGRRRALGDPRDLRDGPVRLRAARLPAGGGGRDLRRQLLRRAGSAARVIVRPPPTAGTRRTRRSSPSTRCSSDGARRPGTGRSPGGDRVSSVDRATLDEPAEAALADEGAVADDGPAADEDRPDRSRDVEALVRRVVARVVEVGGPDRPAGGRVEEDEVGVAADLDRALPAEAEQAGRRRRRGGRPSARR